MSKAAAVGGAILWVVGLTALAYSAVAFAFWSGRSVFGYAASFDQLEFIFFAVAGGALLVLVRLKDGEIGSPLAIAALKLDRIALAFAVATLVFQVIEILVLSTGLFGKAGDFTASSRAMHPLGCMNAIVMAPLVEEALFRGFLYTRTERAAGSAWALVISAAAFAAFHGENGAGYVFAMVPAGCFLGYARKKSGAIALPMAIHAWMNTSIGLFALLFI